MQLQLLERHSYVLDVLLNGRINERLNHHLLSDHPLHLGICSKIVESSNLAPTQMVQAKKLFADQHNLP
ncbi:Uncharacterised protein [Acinetobacter baumannii]|nr:Uncharacterised protein [Acinetobacter baumannii]